MRRKIIKQGHNTLTVSLPKRWCESHNLRDGEEIDISEKGSCLIVSRETYKGSGSVNVDITGLDRSTIILLLHSLYTHGFDTIIITTKDSVSRYYMGKKDISISSIIQDGISRLIGVEITSSSQNMYKIEMIADDSREKFDVVLRTIFRLIIELFEMFIDGIRKKEKGIVDSIDLKHINISRFINYALRLLNKFGHDNADKTTYYFAIVSFLCKADEIVKNFVRHTIHEQRLDLSMKCCDMIEEISTAFKEYYDLFYKYDLKKVSELHKKRDLFKQKLYIERYANLSKDDVFILSGMTQIYDVLLDLIKLRMAITH